MWQVIVSIAKVMATPLLAIGYIPQIISLYKTKKTEGISINFWYILNLGLLCMFILSLDIFITTGSVSMLIAQSFNLGLAIVVMLQVIYYRKKQKEGEI